MLSSAIKYGDLVQALNSCIIENVKYYYLENDLSELIVYYKSKKSEYNVQKINVPKWQCLFLYSEKKTITLSIPEKAWSFIQSHY